MSKNQKFYEVTFIINANLEDTQIDAIIEKVKEIITKNNGEISELTKWGRKRFAYPIKKKNNGFYVLCLIKCSGELISKLERAFVLEDNIIRFLMIALDKKSLQTRISGNDLLKQTAAPTTSGSPLLTDISDNDSLEPIKSPTQSEF